MTVEEMINELKDYIRGNDLKWKPDKCLKYLDFNSGNTTATLDGDFTSKQLMAIALWMQINDEPN